MTQRAEWTNNEHQYLDLLCEVLNYGTPKGDRTGTGTLSIFGAQKRFKLWESFPLLTTKKVSFKNIVLELLWFLRGDTNIKWLEERGCTIWHEWADANGDLGPIYGKQWRDWVAADGRRIDQVAEVIQRIKTTPNDRRLLVSAWNPGEIVQMKLPPCHCLYQFYVADGKLSCQLYQRSCDLFLGVPYNIASYALLTHMIAQVCNLQVGEFIWTGGDVHIYNNQLEQVKLQLSREPRRGPLLKINTGVADIDSFVLEDFGLEGYDPHPAIKADVAV